MKLFVCSLIATLVATANASLTCDCSPEAERCSENKTCISDKDECVLIASSVKSYGAEVPTSLYKACQNSTDTFDLCKAKHIFITAGKNFSLNSEIKCCNKEKCNKGPLQPPKETTNTGKRECPSCFAMNKTCDAIMTKCFESQDRCVNITGDSKTDGKTTDFIIKGCTTSSAASILKKGFKMDIDGKTYSVATVSVSSKDSIMRAPGSIIFAVFLPSLLGILLDKFLH